MLDDSSVGAVVGCQLNDRAASHPLGKLQDVPHGRAAKAVETLILIANDAEILRRFRKLQEQLFLNVVRVLVLIDQNVSDVVCYRLTIGRIAKETVDEPLQVGEVDSIAGEECLLVASIGVSDRRQKSIRRTLQTLDIDELLGNLVEVMTRSLDGGPPGLPLPEVKIVLRRADNLGEVLEKKQELGQVVQSFITVAERRPVAVSRQHAVTETVNRRSGQF